MATINIAKFSATSKIKTGDGADAGVGVVNGDLYVYDGSAARKVADAGDAYVGGVAASYKIVGGQTIITPSAAATATVATGLATVVSVITSLETDPSDSVYLVSGQVGNQAGAPAAGSIVLKTWKPTNVATDVTPTAATAAVATTLNWIAVGT